MTTDMWAVIETAWFKIDDGLHASRKFLSIPRRHRFAAIGVWTVAGSWCADQLTDGRVPDYMISEWNVPPATPAALVDAGLWGRESDGYVFCNWHEYQPRKEDVDAERAASRDRMRELRARRKQPKPQDDAVEPDVFGRTVTNGSENVRNPDPTRPDPTLNTTPNGVVARKRATRIPEPFMVSGEMRAWAAKETPGVNVDATTRKFVDHWRSVPASRGTKLDWVATWRNWLRRDWDSVPPGQRTVSLPPKDDSRQAHAHKWLPDGTCVLCDARRDREDTW